MATHSRIVAWRIPWTEESGRLQSLGLQRVEHDWVTNMLMCACALTHTHTHTCTHAHTHSRERERELLCLPHLIKTQILVWGPHPYDLILTYYFPRAPPPNTITVWLRLQHIIVGLYKHSVYNTRVYLQQYKAAFMLSLHSFIWKICFCWDLKTIGMILKRKFKNTCLSTPLSITMRVCSVMFNSATSPGSSVHEIFHAKILEWVAISFSKGCILDPRIKSVSPTLSGRFFTIEPPGKPINNEVEGITWTIENWKFEGNYLAPFTWNLGEVNSKQPLCLEIDLTISRKMQEYMGFPGGTSGKEPTCQCRGCKRCEFDPWARKIPWRRAWQPTLVSCLENPMERGT